MINIIKYIREIKGNKNWKLLTGFASQDGSGNLNVISFLNVIKSEAGLQVNEVAIGGEQVNTEWWMSEVGRRDTGWEPKEWKETRQGFQRWGNWGDCYRFKDRGSQRLRDEKYKGFGENVSSAFPHGSKVAATAPSIMFLFPVSKSKKKDSKESSPCVSLFLSRRKNFPRRYPE